jgi:RNA polymerase sigma-70 factor (ECF subfamily)
MGSVAGGLQTMIDAHYEALYRYAYRLSGSVADAEDLTQEAFGRAFTRAAQLRDPDRAKGWLFKILRNLYLHRVRDDRRHRVVPLDSVGDLPGREADEPPDIDAARLQQALDELDEGFRTPLILFYFEEFSYRDIAEQMDLPIGTVMSRLARAKTYLRAKLAPPGSDDTAEHETSAREKGLTDPAPRREGSQVT